VLANSVLANSVLANSVLANTVGFAGVRFHSSNLIRR
jgi:hypothetical protein